MASEFVDSSKNDDTRVPYIVWTVGLTAGLSTAAVLLRMYTRLRILHTFGADDAVMVFAQLLTLGSAAAIFSECAFGLGRHIWLMPSNHYVPYMKSFYSSIVVYNVATCVVKMSIMLQYRRIFTVAIMQRITLAGLIFEGAWAFTLSILLPLVCSPVAAFWDVNISGTCLNQLAIWYVMASVNLVTDFVTFSLPLPVIKSLQLPKRQKYMLMGVFCLGFFTCIISIYRIKTLKAAAASADATWDNTDAAVWSFIELSIGVLAACLPTLKPLLAIILPRVFRSTLSGQTNRYVEYGSGKGNTYGGGSAWRKSRTGNSPPFKSGNASVFAKEVDSDMAALRPEGSFTSGGRDLELAAYNVTVTAGSLTRDSDSGSPSQVPRDIMGIQTTTVVTQRVDSL